MKQNLLNIKAILAMLIVTLMVSSCSDSGKLLDSVPANVQTVAILDGERLAKNLEIKIEDGKIQLPPAIERSVGRLDPSVSEIITKASTSIDLEHIVIYAINREAYVTFEIKDAAKFEEAAKEISPNTESVSGYTAYNIKGSTMLVKDNQGWIMGDSNASTAANRVDAAIKAAADKSIADNGKFVDALDKDGIISAVVTAEFYKQLGNANAAEQFEGVGLLADIKDNAFDIDVYTIGAKEKPANDMLTKISPAFLDYAGNNTIFAAAVGIKDGQKWEQALQEAATMLNGSQAQVINMILPYIKEIDGTLSITLAANDINSIKQGNFEMAIMAETAGGAAQSLVDKFDSTITGMGAQGKKEGNMTVYKISDDMTVFTGVVAGRACISNYSPTGKNGASAMKSTFDGKQCAAQLNLPALNSFDGALPPYPAEMKMTYDDAKCNITFKLVGDNNPILLTIINSLNK